MSTQQIELTVNGQLQTVAVEPRRLLADCLRDDLYLTGTKRGCETGVCGACTVLVKERPTKSCLMLAVQANGAQIKTVEGLADENDLLHPLQQAFAENGGLQCGYCTPGFLMSAMALLARNKQPSEQEVRQALEGNLCRCTGYGPIVQSVLAAAKKMRAPF